MALAFQEQIIHYLLLRCCEMQLPAISANLRAHVSAGQADGGPSFGRGIISIGVRTSSMVAPPIDLAATYGRVSARASSFEQFVIGGLPSTLVDPSVVAQRIAMPALPAATAAG